MQPPGHLSAPGAGEELVQPAPAPQPGPALVNLPNALTLLRLALVPVFLVLLFAHGGHATGWRIAAWGAFAVAAGTDRIDGQLARNRGQVTSFGILVDPIADKALIGAALIGLSLLHDLPWAVTVVILVRELGITALRFAVIRHGVMPASRGGKLKTLLQGVGLGLYVLPLSGPFGTLRAVVLTVAVAVTIVTAVDYVGRAVRLRRADAPHG